MSDQSSDRFFAIRLSRSHDMLLRALKEAVAWMDEHDYAPDDAVLDRMRAAIKQAEQT